MLARLGLLAILLFWGLFSKAHLSAADVSAIGAQVAYMQLPPEYRAWFRYPDGSCLAPDTPIATQRGFVAVADLQPARDAIGYLSANGQVRWTHRYQPFVTKQASQLVRITAAGGATPRLTPDHRMGVGTTRPARVSYQRADEICPGDTLASLAGSCRVLSKGLKSESQSRRLANGLREESGEAVPPKSFSCFRRPFVNETPAILGIHEVSLTLTLLAV